MVTKLSPVDARAVELIKQVSTLPVDAAKAAGSAPVDSVSVQAGNGFDKFRATAGRGTAALFADKVPQFADRVSGLFAALQGEPIDVQAAVLAKLVHDVTPVRE